MRPETFRAIMIVFFMFIFMTVACLIYTKKELFIYIIAGELLITGWTYVLHKIYSL